MKMTTTTMQSSLNELNVLPKAEDLASLDYNDLPEPFLGRMIVEVITESTAEFKRRQLGIKKDSLIAVPDEVFGMQTIYDDYGNAHQVKEEQRATVPHKHGKILKIAPDAFGEAFMNRYKCPTKLNVGDIVWFVPMQTYKLDEKGKFHIIGDEDIIAYKRGQ